MHFGLVWSDKASFFPAARVWYMYQGTPVLKLICKSYYPVHVYVKAHMHGAAAAVGEHFFMCILVDSLYAHLGTHTTHTPHTHTHT